MNRQALDGRREEKVLGKEHPDTLTSNNLSYHPPPQPPPF